MAKKAVPVRHADGMSYQVPYHNPWEDSVFLKEAPSDAKPRREGPGVYQGGGAPKILPPD